jgi:hypothetical protein
MLTNEQKCHDIAVAFAAAEYQHEIERRHTTLEAAQQGASIFLFLYERALEEFKRSKHHLADI